MKNILCIVLLLVFCFNFCACGKTKDKSLQKSDEGNSFTLLDRSNSSDDSDIVEDKNNFNKLSPDYDNTITVKDAIKSLLSGNKQSYEIQTKKLTREGHNGNLDVKYPIIISSNFDTQKINSLIYNLVDSYVNEENDINQTIDGKIEYKITKSNDNIISILFSGIMNSRTAAHPNNISFTFNYNLNANKIITMPDIVNIDNSFLKKCKGTLEKQFEKGIYSAILDANQDVDVLINGLKGSDSQYYFEDNKLFIGFSIPAGAGFTDYICFDYKY